MPTTRRRWCRCVRHAGAVFCGPWAPASVGDYVAGPSHVLPTDGSARFGSALTVSRLPEAHARHHPRPRRRSPRSARTSRRWPRPRASTPTPTRSAGARRGRGDRPWHATASRPATTSPSWRATTRRRSTSTVRLNTNESPVPPPAAFREALADELADVDWHRYPDRAALELRTAIGALHGVGPEQVFAANGSNEVLQTLCLAYGGAGRTVAVFEPTYALHAHIARITGTAVAVGERTDDFALDLDEVAGCSPSRSGHHVPVLAQQPDRAGRAAGGRRGRARAGARGSSWSTRPTGSSPRGRRSSWSTRTCRWSSPAPSPRRGRWRRPASATSSARVAGRRAREGRAAVPPRRGQAGRRPARARLHRRDGGAGRRAGRGAGPAVRGARRPRRRRVAVGRQLRAVPAPVQRRRARCGRSCSTARCWSATARPGPASTAACGSRSAPAPRTTASSRPSRRSSDEPRAAAQGAHDQGDRDRRRARPRRAHGHGGDVSTGLPFFDHMLDQLGRHGGFDLTVQADGRPGGRRPPHRRGRRHPARRDLRARRSATRPACAASPAASYPLDEALVEVALDLSGRPVRRLRRARSARCCRSATRRSTRRWPSTSGSRSRPRPASRCT